MATDCPIPQVRDEFTVDGRTVLIRPIRPDDREREAAFVRGLSHATRYFRFHSALRELTPEMLERFTHVDFPNDMALVAVVEGEQGEEQIGVARYARTAEPDTAEIAVVVADDWQGRGIATRLLTNLRTIARQTGIRHLVATVLRENGRMLGLMRHLGFVAQRGEAGYTSRLGKRVEPPDGAA